MNPGRYFMPGMGGMMGVNTAPMMAMSLPMTRNIGLFGRLGNSLKSFNWGNLLNGANKTLNVVNQTIPLIRQTKPMINNVKSMFRLAKAFGSETDSKITTNNQVNVTNNVSNKNLTNKNTINESNETKSITSNYPNFFI